ncbi:hypothetical protein NW759_003431 [Fusarium solani]|uniref:Tetratricopeptide-like helical n=2 Tax=Fusarium solani TaxID=169388 RepID=A0A9P9L2A8_FUSSL|nr:uncharacterized protein B0J15DRAFT_590466 [Fusarium solani]KAH7272645.1 hypothetical protein B0J15DRAFT_590466 [Fusarium solani]KAJ4230070.1 hypothetical protein NW759_003431 [Fusarium solani]
MSRHLRARRLCSQLLCSTSKPLLTTQPCGLKAAGSSQSTSTALPQAHSYATQQAPRAPRAPKAPAARPSNSELFDISSITPGDIKTIIDMTEGTFDTLSPEEYHKVALLFQDAIKKGASPWSVKLPKEDDVPAHVLHELACILRFATKQSQLFAGALWTAASNMGYRPSTISLAREIIGSGFWGKASQYRNIESRFKQIVQEGKDRNALTAEGERLYRLGMYDAAVKVLQRALGPEGSEFEWKHHCQLCLGRSYLKLGRTAEAKELLEGVEGAGSGEAAVELAQLFRTSDPDKMEQYLYTAGINGRLEMFRQLSEIEFEKEARETDKASKKEHNLWAMEWSRLADEREKI